jgi:hypothetical protein
MSTIRKKAVAEREVIDFVLASLSDRDCFLCSFYTLVFCILSLSLSLSFSAPIFICVSLDMDQDSL